MKSLLPSFRFVVRLSELRLARAVLQRELELPTISKQVAYEGPFKPNLGGRRPGHHVRGGLTALDFGKSRTWGPHHEPSALSSAASCGSLRSLQYASAASAAAAGRQRASHHEPGAAQGQEERERERDSTRPTRPLRSASTWT